MRYHAFATDYDGTLAAEGVVRPETFAALERLRASGRKVILVTGRELGDLKRVCPRLENFDLVIAENGALLYRPGSREEVLLAEPPPPELAERLRARGVRPLSEGRVIVATREPYETEAVEVIRDLGIETQIAFNQGAVMLLPSGVNKQSGLVAALRELGLSLRNTVTAGDAENDHSMLAASECGVAVANAIPALKDRADLVTRGSRGRGVQELVERLLADDLRSVVVPRHALLLGERHDGTVVHVAPYGRRVLFAGATAGAAALVERLMDRGYQCCIVDSAGQCEGFEGVAGVGTSERAPSVEEVLEVLANPAAHVSVSLAAVSDQRAFFAELLERLRDMRHRLGRPHWIVVGEAHEVVRETPRDPGAVLLVTPHPERLPRGLLDGVHTAIAESAEALRPLCGDAAAREVPGEDEVVVWSNGRIEPLRLVRANEPRPRRIVDGAVAEKQALEA